MPTSRQKTYRYDVFVSYSSRDSGWVQEELVPRLKKAGLKIFNVDHELPIGAVELIDISVALQESRYIIPILTPRWIQDENSQYQVLLAQTDDPRNRQRRVLPLLLETCNIPYYLAILNRADFTDPAKQDNEWMRLLRAIGKRAHVFITYERNTRQDEALEEKLRIRLGRAGNHVSSVQTIPIGAHEAKEIEHQIEISDFIVVLLSEASVRNELVMHEVEYAHRHFQRTRKPYPLPVRVGYSSTLPYPLSEYLGSLRYAQWRSEADTARLVRQLLDAIGHHEDLPSLQQEPPTVEQEKPFIPPHPYADPSFIASLRMPGGSMSLQSAMYIERASDELLRRELSKLYGTTTTIRAPRQTGKSSLLIRGAAHAEMNGSRVIFIDLQMVNESQLQNLDTFLRYFAEVVAMNLELSSEIIEDVWRGPLGTPDRATSLMEKFALPRTDTKLVLTIDEADTLLKTQFHTAFFGLLRSWHNKRARNRIWDKFDLVLVISTEPNLLIKDLHQSPFNVGLKIKLEDFNIVQLNELNETYRSPLKEQEISEIKQFLNGHPYLTSKAIYTMVTENMTWSQLRRVASDEEGPFSDHLRRYLWLLGSEPQLTKAIKQVISRSRCPNEMLYYRLQQAGLVKRVAGGKCECRCQLYHEYLKDML